MIFMQKNPGLAAVLSFFVTGLGQIYNGQIGKGIALFAGAVVSGLLCAVVIGFILLPAVWLYGIYDAYRTAEKINKGAGESVAG
jgi:TM2 domain-containing membrane protein YozV